MVYYCIDCRYRRNRHPPEPFRDTRFSDPEMYRLKSEWLREIDQKKDFERERVRELLDRLESIEMASKLTMPDEFEGLFTPGQRVLWLEEEPWFHDVCKKWRIV